jgi:Tol biopolymer transport system component/serine/threonine protein kinase
MADLSGQTLGPYQIIELIGKGGMASVYRARQPSIGREVAIKVLSGELHADTFLARFEREVQVIARLQHPHILPVYDYGHHRGSPYIVMAYMPGGTLADRVREWGPLPLDEVVRIVEGVADALDFAHAKGIIHRDVKPSNILLDESDNPYLCDFGLVKMTEATVQTTGSGIVGTPAYMAPEQSEPGPPTPAMDIYALGVTAFEIITGQTPYQADTPIAQILAHIQQPVPSLRDHYPDLPPLLDETVRRALAKFPEDRFGTAGQFAEALREAAPVEAAAHAPTPARPAVRSTKPAVATPPALVPRRRASPTLIVALIALMVAGLALGAVLVGGGRIGGPTAGPPPQFESGGRIAFGSDRDGNNDIYLMDTAGGNIIQLTDDPSNDWTPVWSPDGARLAVVSDRDGDPNIYLMSADGRNMTQLTDDPAYDLNPTWSPDGLYIAFDSGRGGDTNIYIMEADGGHVTQLTDEPALDWSPVWSPDGEHIAFVSDRDGSDDIYLTSADVRDVTQLTEEPGRDLNPAWSPDGERIAFASDRDGDLDIYVMRADGQQVVQLTDDPADDWAPVWSPDGTRIAFVSERGGNPDIYLLNPASRDVARLTANPAADVSPAWEPSPTTP